MEKIFFTFMLLTLCLGHNSNQAIASETSIQKQLDAVALKLVQWAAGSVMPSKAQKKVTKEGNIFVARYVEIDPNTLTTELRPSETKGQYVGLIKYVENFYECQGNTAETALNSTCYKVRARRLTEIISYDKKWHH